MNALWPERQGGNCWERDVTDAHVSKSWGLIMSLFYKEEKVSQLLHRVGYTMHDKLEKRRHPHRNPDGKTHLQIV